MCIKEDEEGKKTHTKTSFLKINDKSINKQTNNEITYIKQKIWTPTNTRKHKQTNNNKTFKQCHKINEIQMKTNT